MTTLNTNHTDTENKLLATYWDIFTDDSLKPSDRIAAGKQIEKLTGLSTDSGDDGQVRVVIEGLESK